MIPEKIQFNIIFFSFLYGLFFYYSLSLAHSYLINSKVVKRFINTITFFAFVTLVYFIGLQVVSNGILHIYSLFVIIITGYLARLIANKKK